MLYIAIIYKDLLTVCCFTLFNYVCVVLYIG